MKYFYLKFLKDPIGTIKRIFLKTIYLPKKYGKTNDYDAHNYWKERFEKYNLAMKAVGDEGLSETDNIKARENALSVLSNVCRKENINFEKVRVLEIGCGNGFYTDFLSSAGVQDYTGIDITDVLFPQLIERFAHFNFIKKDVATEKIQGAFDLIVMMDVIQHIVTKDKLAYALDNIRSSLVHKGIFIVAPIRNESRRHLFHVHIWSLNDINQIFSQNFSIETVPFRENESLSIIKNNK